MVLMFAICLQRTFDYRRFVLPDLNIATLGSGNVTGYEAINGSLGEGFLEKQFPGTFKMTAVKVNPASMDVFFIGNEVRTNNMLFKRNSFL